MLALMDFYGADVGQFTSAAMFFLFFVCLFVCFGRVLFRTAVFGVFCLFVFFQPADCLRAFLKNG